MNWSPIFRLPEVVLGVYVGMVFGRKMRFQGEGVFLALYAAASFCQMEAGELLAMPETVAALTWAGLVVGVIVAAAAVLLFVVLSRSAGLESFRWLGNAAFPFFLIHGVAIRFLYARYGPKHPYLGGVFCDLLAGCHCPGDGGSQAAGDEPFPEQRPRLILPILSVLGTKSRFLHVLARAGRRVSLFRRTSRRISGSAF